MSRAFNFNHLYYFHVVASEGSLARAAARLHVTEPTISAQVRQLEQFVGHRLFIRTARGLRLTPKGEYTAEHTSLMFRAGQRLMQGLQPGATQTVSLSIGVSSSVANTLAARVFVPLFADGILVQVRHGDHDYLLRDLLSRDIDILLGDRELVGRASRGLVTAEITRPRFVAVAPKQMARKVKRFPADLGAIPLVLYPPRSRYRWELERYFSDHGVEPRILGETEDIGIMLSCVQSRTCGAILPRQQVEPLLGKNIVELGDVNIESAVFAYTQRVDVSDLVQRAITTLVKQHTPSRSRAHKG